MALHQFENPITYISDCRDDNTQGRLKARVATLFPGSNVVFVGVKSDFEAAINLVDVVDAYDGRPGVILVNVAPRHGDAKKWENGTPFSWIKLDNVDIFSTIDGYTLSLLQKLLHHDIKAKVYDIPHVVPHMNLDKETQDRIIHTQFRSFDYLPRLAAHIMEGTDLPVTEIFDSMPIMPASVCWVDCFGNLKTNMLPEEINFEVGAERVIRTKNKQFLLPCYNRLKDIPDGEVALTVGSSGLNHSRFIEVMVQGASASAALGLTSGDLLEFVPDEA